MILVIILVSNESLESKRELRSIVHVRPELFVTTSGHLALMNASDHGPYIVFDRPYGLIDDNYQRRGSIVKLLDLEKGEIQSIRRYHLDIASEYQFIVPAF